ncbi:MAG: endolytic transglycosylase MltG [Myxococcales bacterium]|nr:endolytic transglycosylase MltG [Myxococcales bacterium]
MGKPNLSNSASIPSRQTRRWPWIVAVILAPILFILAWYCLVIFRPIAKDHADRIVISIPSGGFHNTAAVFAASGIVTPALFFEIHGTLLGARRKVRTGAYFVDPNWSPHELLQHIVAGDNRAVYRVTLPEGLNIWQTAQRLDQAGAATAAEFLQTCSDWTWAAKHQPIAHKPTPEQFPGRNLTDVSALEGYLFPSTYEFVWGSSTEDIVKTMLDLFNVEWTRLSQQYANSKAALAKEFGFRDHDFVILASLVEKEVQRSEERPVVASVFYNRLRQSMKLQTDPTLVYSAVHYADKPSPAHRKDDTNPYNTYAFPGLPPGPIANPGRDSLRAVLAPEVTDYLFFVAKNDGSGGHFFSKTFAEHRKAIQGEP